MAEPELLLQQRQILRAFRQAVAARTRAETEANHWRQTAHKNADAGLAQTRSAAGAHLAAINSAWQAVQQELKRPNVSLRGVELQPRMQAHSNPPNPQPAAALSQSAGNVAAAARQMAGLLEQLQAV